MKIPDIKHNCIHFKGYIPCVPNKQRGKICNNCDEYQPIKKRILIIKLGAIGDVIRTTPLVEKYKTIFPDCHITWITQFPDILPHNKIDSILSFDFVSVFKITHDKFDIAINLDKDFEACALLYDTNASEKYGFILINNFISPVNKLAEHKFLTGIFDKVSKQNTKSYLEEIFEICGFDFNGEEYLMPFNKEHYEKWNIINKLSIGKKIIGFNTGCGARWKTRLWPEKYWIELIKRLAALNYFPVILGGKDEDKTNLKYAEITGVYYPGYYTLAEYIEIVRHCKIIVSAVSLTMHIAIGLQKTLILFNNIFNKNEFELYGRGEILEPNSGCDCYYGQICKREKFCMEDLLVDNVFNAIIKHSK